jgi:hypothetical protein
VLLSTIKVFHFITILLISKIFFLAKTSPESRNSQKRGRIEMSFSKGKKNFVN